MNGGGVVRRAETLSLFVHRVRDFVVRPPVMCDARLSAVEIAQLLSRAGVGAVLVSGEAGAAAGIVTDRDLRHKVVAGNRDAVVTRAGDIMSTPLITIPATAFAFEAILEMTRREIHHLPVTEDGRVVGMVSSDDFLWRQAAHPVTLAREIGQAESIEALARHAQRGPGLVRRLLDAGGTAYDVAQIVAELNDRIVTRALGLVTAQLHEAGEAAPPLPYCWLAFGSEARREQTLRTDQDNGLAYADPPPELASQAAAYYARLAHDAIRALISLGFPACPGNFMASNPRWCQPASRWAEYFRSWMSEPTPEQVLAACIFFDVRPIAGAQELGTALRTLLQNEAPAQPVFLRLLARGVADRRVPLTLFGNVAVRRRGPQRGRVDLKMAGGIQLVGAARLHALALGLEQTNTIDRFRAAAARGVYREDEVREITDAYQHVMRLRIVHQLDQAAGGQPMDNDVDPKRLTHADRLLLRDALRTVSRVQADILERFAAALTGS